MSWVDDLPALGALDARARSRLDHIVPGTIEQGAVLFRPGDSAKGFVILLKGRIDVYLVGPIGRDILLYDVQPGTSCIQSTLGLLGGDAYSAEGVAATHCRAVLLPRRDFLALIDESPAFRTIVLSSLAARMQSIMHLVEQVAFARLDQRLARVLLARAVDGVVHATHAELARELGTAREVVSRKLDAFSRRGLLDLGRGRIGLVAPGSLADMARDGTSQPLL